MFVPQIRDELEITHHLFLGNRRFLDTAPSWGRCPFGDPVGQLGLQLGFWVVSRVFRRAGRLRFQLRLPAGS